MATYQPTNLRTQFDSVAAQIHKVFDPLVAQLVARRNALLLELSQLREEYTSKETTRRAAIENIEKLSLKVEINIPIFQQANEAYKQQLKQLATSTKLRSPHLACPTLAALHNPESQFAEFGDVPNYTLKKDPILTAGKFGIGPTELLAAGLAIDELNKRIYLADWYNTRIQIVTFEGAFIGRFGQEWLCQPHGIALTSKHIFVTDTALHTLFQFHRTSFQLVNRTGTEGYLDGEFDEPRGLCTDSTGNIFVVDSRNHRVCRFSKSLRFLSKLGAGRLTDPRDVKLTHDGLVVVLDWGFKCVHFFSKNGQLLRSCVSQGEAGDGLVDKPSFFCLDTAGNFIISDCLTIVLR